MRSVHGVPSHRSAVQTETPAHRRIVSFCYMYCFPTGGGPWPWAPPRAWTHSSPGIKQGCGYNHTLHLAHVLSTQVPLAPNPQVPNLRTTHTFTHTPGLNTGRRRGDHIQTGTRTCGHHRRITPHRTTPPNISVVAMHLPPTSEIRRSIRPAVIQLTASRATILTFGHHSSAANTQHPSPRHPPPTTV